MLLLALFLTASPATDAADEDEEHPDTQKLLAVLQSVSFAERYYASCEKHPTGALVTSAAERRPGSARTDAGKDNDGDERA